MWNCVDGYFCLQLQVVVIAASTTKANYLLIRCQQRCSWSTLNTNGFAGGFVCVLCWSNISVIWYHACYRRMWYSIVCLYSLLVNTSRYTMTTPSTMKHSMPCQMSSMSHCQRWNFQFSTNCRRAVNFKILNL